MATMLNPNAIPDGSITKEKIDASVLEAKQDTISDLNTIRTNANKGATALQSYTETDPVYMADKPKIALKSEIPNISGLATKEEVAGKQDTLTPGNGISIKDNKIDVTAITESESQPSTHLWVNPSEDAETDVTYNRSQIDALVGAKQDTLRLTVKDNGNIVLANIQGQSKEFMPATPSGDPMHWLYIAAGAEYNDTGADIVKTAPWKDMVDDDADKTVIHKAGYWYLNGLGDLSNEDMRVIFVEKPTTVFFNDSLCKLNGRTNFEILRTDAAISISRAGHHSKSEVSCIKEVVMCSVANSIFYNCPNLRHIIATFDMSYITAQGNLNEYTFSYNPKLQTVKIAKLKVSIYIKYSPLLTCKSILYMINNENATTNITITLHADAYARAMANADIVAALEAHPNVSLASA